MIIHWKTVFATTTVVAAATWAVSLRFNENLRESIDSYEKAKTWNVPEAVAATDKAAKELAKLAANINDVSVLRQSVQSFSNNLLEASERELQESNTIQNLRGDIAKLNVQINTLQTDYSDIQSVTVPEGGSVQLFKQKLSVGVSSVVTSFAETYINNELQNLSAGQSVDVAVDSVKFRVTMVSIKPGEKQADFSARLLK